MHKVIEQTGDISEAIGGICERDAHAGARLLYEMELKNEDAAVLHGKLSALATNMSFLLNSLNSSPKEGLAALAGSHPVVLTWGLVSTNGTRVNYHRTPSTVQI